MVVVTGASAGLGRAIGREFARRRASIGLIARGIDGLAGAKSEVEAAGGQALVLPLDLQLPESSSMGRVRLATEAHSSTQLIESRLNLRACAAVVIEMFPL